MASLLLDFGVGGSVFLFKNTDFRHLKKFPVRRRKERFREGSVSSFKITKGSEAPTVLASRAAGKRITGLMCGAVHTESKDHLSMSLAL